MSSFEGEVTVGYWAIRGLAAPLRMMVMFSGRTLNSVHYECVSDANGKDFDHSAWFSVKDGLKEENALVNLPYVRVGDGPLVTQSTACFLHLGRHLRLLGDSELELTQVEQLLCEAMDLRNSIVRFAYSGEAALLDQWLRSTVDLAKNTPCAKLDLWLRRKYTAEELGAGANVFFVGSRACAAEFHIWELLDQIVRMAQVDGARSGATSVSADSVFCDAPGLLGFYKSFAGLEQNQRYLQSALHGQLPVNNLTAKTFGATPSGAAWDFAAAKEDMPWLGLSGRY